MEQGKRKKKETFSEQCSDLDFLTIVAGIMGIIIIFWKSHPSNWNNIDMARDGIALIFGFLCVLTAYFNYRFNVIERYMGRR